MLSIEVKGNQVVVSGEDLDGLLVDQQIMVEFDATTMTHVVQAYWIGEKPVVDHYILGFEEEAGERVKEILDDCTIARPGIVEEIADLLRTISADVPKSVRKCSSALMNAVGEFDLYRWDDFDQTWGLPPIHLKSKFWDTHRLVENMTKNLFLAIVAAAIPEAADDNAWAAIIEDLAQWRDRYSPAVVAALNSSEFDLTGPEIVALVTVPASLVDDQEVAKFYAAFGREATSFDSAHVNTVLQGFGLITRGALDEAVDVYEKLNPHDISRARDNDGFTQPYRAMAQIALDNDRAGLTLAQVIEVADMEEEDNAWADYPDTTIALLLEAADADRNAHTDGMTSGGASLPSEMATAMPPVPLPVDPHIRFLSTVGDIRAERRRLDHLVGDEEGAVAGRTFVFAVRYAGQRATVEMLADGSFSQVNGSDDDSSLACEYGAAVLSAWGATFPTA